MGYRFYQNNYLRESFLFYPLIALIATSLASCSYSAKATRRYLQAAREQSPFDAIVVPGVPFENGNWDYIMKGRVYWSKYLYEQGFTRNIIYSGSAVYSPYYEGKIMELYAKALGIPEEHIFSEIKAEHSTENAYYGFKMARQLGFEKVALASDPFQSKLLRRYIKRKVDKEMVVIPMVVDTMKAIQPQMLDPQIPYEEAFKPDFISIKQRDSWWKRMRGTIRGNLDTTAYSTNY